MIYTTQEKSSRGTALIANVSEYLLFSSVVKLLAHKWGPSIRYSSEIDGTDSEVLAGLDEWSRQRHGNWIKPDPPLPALLANFAMEDVMDEEQSEDI